jgi:hypothetical protein
LQVAAARPAIIQQVAAAPEVIVALFQVKVQEEEQVLKLLYL